MQEWAQGFAPILFLVPEMPLTREDHRDSVMIRHANSLLIAYRTTWLNNSRYARFSRGLDTIGKGKEGIRGQYRATCSHRGLLYRQLHTGNTVHLSRPNTYYRQFACQHNRI